MLKVNICVVLCGSVFTLFTRGNFPHNVSGELFISLENFPILSLEKIQCLFRLWRTSNPPVCVSTLCRTLTRILFWNIEKYFTTFSHTTIKAQPCFSSLWWCFSNIFRIHCWASLLPFSITLVRNHLKKMKQKDSAIVWNKWRRLARSAWD